MFERTLRALRQLEGRREIAIQLPVDADGNLDRQCPAENCATPFQVVGDDWRDRVRSEVVYCPFCRHESPSDSWHTEKQLEYAKAVVVRGVEAQLEDALRADAHSFNFSGNSSVATGLFNIGMTMDFRPGLPSPIPLALLGPMRQEFACETCACRWSSLGASFFCPACGDNSAPTSFKRTLSVVRSALGALAVVRDVMAREADPETAEDITRLILEEQFPRLVGALERYSEALFDSLPNAGSFTWKGNVFQRLPDASKLWRAAVGVGYEDILSPAEWQRLQILFQQRHVLGHRQGIVDLAYVKKSGDGSYSVGQRLVVRRCDVLEFVGLVDKLAQGLYGLANVP